MPHDSPVPIIVRPIVAAEFDAYIRTNGIGFGNLVTPERIEALRPGVELDRTTAAFAGDELVGTAGVISFEMSVPGGSLPTAGVTAVAVLPTHRRRGVLTAMMRQQLDAIRDRGEAVAALTASESGIYERFGYGMAAQNADLRIERAHAGLRHAGPAGGRTRLVDAETALARWPALHERVRCAHPGMFARSHEWWDGHVLRPRDAWWGVADQFLVQYEDDGEVLGYARYTIASSSQDGLPTGVVNVHEQLADGPAAYAALWQYLFGIDLIGTISARGRRIDEPLVYMLEDSRRLSRRLADGLWARIVDVPGALEGRRYRGDGTLTFRIRDGFCPWTEGTYELVVDGGRARCTRTTAGHELDLGIADLGAIFYGGTACSALAAAGRVTGAAEHLVLADRLFHWDPAPWCPETF